MKRFAVAVSLLLLASCAAHAATTTNASLKGIYFFQLTQVSEVYWGKNVSITCFKNNYSMWLGGQQASTKLTTGTINASGAGSFTISATQYGVFNPTASNATVSISCGSSSKNPIVTNSGSAVFDPPTTLATTGNYTVTSSGTGTMTLAGGKSSELIDISLGQLNGSNVAGVVLISQPYKPNANYNTGIAILQ
jgi:hypothetical protein